MLDEILDAVSQWRWRNERLVLFALSAALVLGFFACIVALSAEMDRLSCNETAAAMGLRGRWTLLTSCMVGADGKMAPLSAYKVIRTSP
jgi:hypothetical protein